MNSKRKLSRAYYVFMLSGSSYMVLRGLYVYFVLGTLALVHLLIAVVFFGTGVVVGAIGLTSPELLDPRKLDTKTSLVTGACSAALSLVCLAGLLFFKRVGTLQKSLFLVGFLFFGAAPLALLLRRRRDDR